MTVFDPVINTSYPISGFIGGGNPKLKPELSNSTTVGFTLTPARLEGFNFSVDYVDIDIVNAFGSLGLAAIAWGLYTLIANGDFSGLLLVVAGVCGLQATRLMARSLWRSRNLHRRAAPLEPD